MVKFIGSITFGRAITADDWKRLNDIVYDASMFWDMLPDGDVHYSDLSRDDAYRLGYVSAVLKIMDIFCIPECRVKK